MKRKKMTIEERIQYYKDQGITEVTPLFHDPDIEDFNHQNLQTFEFELVFKLPEGVSNDDALGMLSQSCCEVTIGIGKEGELGVMFNQAALTLEEAINTASNLISEIIPGTELKL